LEVALLILSRKGFRVALTEDCEDERSMAKLRSCLAGVDGRCFRLSVFTIRSQKSEHARSNHRSDQTNQSDKIDDEAGPKSPLSAVRHKKEKAQDHTSGQ